MDITFSPSPNFDDRKHPVDMLVLHYTGMETGEAAFDQLRNPDAKVSSHYLLREDGRVDQLVAEDRRAWHAGVSSWQGDEDLNSRSIGIEIVNGGHDFLQADGSLPPYPAAQIDALIALCHKILAGHDIPQTRIVGHSDIAPLRKQDPGEHFPWEQLARAGIGIWPDVEGKDFSPGDENASVQQTQEQLQRIGYGLPPTGTYDDLTEAVVRAFQRRWLPDRTSGVADARTLRRIGEIHALYAAR
ncbi:N-acetylmuramoyl-L-alanine amidase [uncultured Hyphomonas sp.]|uniref:peptidoglycan recognition protein family protein n=1 Tax=uncultured Hyphomonas sp. TaxID=225298 RepID=UPI002AAAA0EA|nr:N-acetylmuramoyl-L-alanine amidase [uncultured Hyphomonas sp.]